MVLLDKNIRVRFLFKLIFCYICFYVLTIRYFILVVAFMKKIEQIYDTHLLMEIWDSLITEKSDLIWSLPFTEELHEHIVQELFVQNPLSKN